MGKNDLTNNYMQFIDKLIEKILKKTEVTVYQDHQSLAYKVHTNFGAKEILKNQLLEDFKEEFEKLEVQDKKRVEFENYKEIEKLKLEKERQEIEINLKSKQAVLEQSIRLETDADKQAMMKIGLENVELKKRIEYLEVELKYARESASNANTAVNETLKTAFKNQPQITVNTK